MAMLDLLLSGSLPSNSLATNEVFACVVFVMKEIFSGFHNWRYRSLHDRDEIGMTSPLHHMLFIAPLFYL